MAPPDQRRTGTSRRAQYFRFTGYVLAALGALVGAALLILSLRQPDSFASARSATRDMVAPATVPGRAARVQSKGIVETVTAYLHAGSQNRKLREEMALARIRLAEAQALKQENARLKGLLGLREDQRYGAVATTQFIGSTASSARRFGYIGAGLAQGVRPGMPVRSARGMVGRVLEAGRNSSRVLLLSDSQSVVPVRLARADVAAFAEGRGDGLIRIRLINLGVNPVRKGDLFVTSGTGGYYAPGAAVAIVTKVTEDGALARMVSDPAATDFVAVMPVWQADIVAAAQTPVEQAVED